MRRPKQANRPAQADQRPRFGPPSPVAQVLRAIHQAWGIRDVADAIPESLRPRGEWHADKWQHEFALELARIAKAFDRTNLPEIQQMMQDTVEVRRKKHPDSCTYLAAEDLKSVLRDFGLKRKAEKELEKRRLIAVELERKEKERVELAQVWADARRQNEQRPRPRPRVVAEVKVVSRKDRRKMKQERAESQVVTPAVPLS